MEKVFSFVEIAKEIVSEFKAGFDSGKNCDFVNYQLYVSILDDGNIQTSTRPNVLNKGKECLIILAYNSLAVTNYYRWYAIKHIDENGNIHEGFNSDVWSIEINWIGSWANKEIILKKEGKELYSVRVWSLDNPLEEPFHKLWDFYKIVKNCSSTEEIHYVAENYELKEKIKKQNEEICALDFVKKKLEMERDQYRSLFKEMKEIIKGENK